MDRSDAVAQFAHATPSLDSYWRAIILFGQNVASYKFALAGAVLEIGADNEVVSLDALALPYATRVAEHLRTHDKQGTFQKSRFLDACRAFNSGELDADSLRARTVKLGFQNVIDASTSSIQIVRPLGFAEMVHVCCCRRDLLAPNRATAQQPVTHPAA